MLLTSKVITKFTFLKLILKIFSPKNLAPTIKIQTYDHPSVMVTEMTSHYIGSCLIKIHLGKD